MSARQLGRPATLCVHGGVERDDPPQSLVPPLVQSTAYAWRGLEHPPPVSYGREGNPTVAALERRLASIEGGSEAVCFGSGLAALDALLRCLPVGSRVVAGRHLYGGSTRLLQQLFGERLKVDVVDSTVIEDLDAALDSAADLVLVETPSNPTLRVTDIREAARAAHRAGAFLAVDNTFMTPLYQQPLALGADISLHSTTKYIEGHNATLGGAVVLAESASADRPGYRSLGNHLRWVRKATGAVLSPFEAWLTLQGTKTLHLRTREQWRTAGLLARSLRDHPAVVQVAYPGLADHPGHQIHRGQSTGDGGIVAVDLGSGPAARRFLSRLTVFTLAENLGATESIATHPASMTHSDLEPARRALDGIGDGLVRLSVGVEDADDILSDVLQALDSMARVVAGEVA